MIYLTTFLISFFKFIYTKWLYTYIYFILSSCIVN